VIPLTRAIPERIRCGYNDALYKSTFTLLYFTLCIANPPFEVNLFLAMAHEK